MPVLSKFTLHPNSHTMKKVFTLLAFALIIFGIESNAQCTIDPAATTPGVYPSDLPTGIINKEYYASATVRFPVDTLVDFPPFGTFLLPYDSIQITNIYNLPAGLTWDCGTPDCKAYAGDLITCAAISGTPTEVTNPELPIQAEITGWLTAPIVGVQVGAGTQDLLIDIIDVPTTSITAFTNRSDHGTTVQWTSDAVGDANDSWVLRHHEFGNSPNYLYKVTGPTMASAYTNNLQPNTRYVYRAGFRASGNTSASFSDTASVWTRCTMPTVFGSRTGVSFIDIDLEDNNQVSTKIRYRAEGTSAWSYHNTTNLSATLMGLESGTNYELQMRALCGSNGGTSYTSIATYATSPARLSAGIAEIGSMRTYPNPTEGNITLDLPAIEDGRVLANMLDVSGRVIMREQINLNQGMNRHVFELSGLTNGIYILQLNDKGSITSHRIVKH